MKLLKETLLLVNSDLYKTGTKKVDEIDVPNVISALSKTVFKLQGYPESNTEKLILILISRYIEQQALEYQTGTFRASFQYLSRVKGERGTKRVYEKISQVEELDAHIYGYPDYDPPLNLDVTIHDITDNDKILDYWFVTYRSDNGQDVAMVSEEVEKRTWKGYWTFDSEEIKAIDQCIEQTF